MSPLHPSRLDELPFDGEPCRLVEECTGPAAEIPKLHDHDGRFGRSQHMAHTVEIDILGGGAGLTGHPEAHQDQDPSDPAGDALQKRPHVVR